MVVAAYVEQLTGALSAPSVKQHLAALHMLFDWLVVGQVLPFNPASSVKGPKHVVKTGKTPVLSAAETRALLDGIDISTLAGLRDRALLGVLIYSFARVSAAISLRVGDYYTQGQRTFFRLHEKGGRYNVVPAHHTAQGYVHAYLAAAGIGEDHRGPLFRPFPSGRNDRLLDQPMTRATALKIIKRRAAQAGLPRKIRAHSFRGTALSSICETAATSSSPRASPATSPPAPPSSITACQTRARSTRLSGFPFERLVVTDLNRPRKPRTSALGSPVRVVPL